MRKKKKMTNAQKRKKSRQRYRKQSKEKYIGKIDTINAIIQEYHNAFGYEGYEYNKIMADVEKILGNDIYSTNYISHGSENTSGKVYKTIAGTVSTKLRYRISRLEKYLKQSEDAYSILKREYGFTGSLTKENKKYIHMKSALKKLQNDALPNYYDALNLIVDYKTQLKFRKEFSEKLKGRKRDTKEAKDEYKRLYDEIGAEIMEYIEKISDEGINQIERLKKSSIIEEVKPSTLAEALRRK